MSVLDFYVGCVSAYSAAASGESTDSGGQPSPSVARKRLQPDAPGNQASLAPTLQRREVPRPESMEAEKSGGFARQEELAPPTKPSSPPARGGRS